MKPAQDEPHRESSGASYPKVDSEPNTASPERGPPPPSTETKAPAPGRGRVHWALVLFREIRGDLPREVIVGLALAFAIVAMAKWLAAGA